MSFKFYRAITALTSALLLFACAAHGQNPPRTEVAGIPVNYDESRVGAYTLPDPLKLNDGAPASDAKTWLQKRRPEIVRLFEENQFGRSPGRPAGMSFDVFDKGAPALDGKAIRKQVTVYFSRDKTGPIRCRKPDSRSCIRSATPCMRADMEPFRPIGIYS